MSHHCRCRHCGARRALRQAPELYQVVPQCRRCGSRDLRSDKWMNERNTRDMTCSCDGHGPGFHHPHRRGSLWCNYQANGEWKSLEQFAAEHATLEESA